MVDQGIAAVVRRYLEQVNAEGIPVSFGVLFGSQTTPDHAQAWSDVDLIVVSPRFDPPMNRADVNRLWHIAARIDSRIEPIPCGEQQWDQDGVSTIIEVGRRQGTRIEIRRGA